MAIVRELVTVLGTAVDQTGFKQYETGIARIKALALSIGSAFGLAFGADKIIEFAEGLVSAGKEINRLGAQLKVIARPFDDVGAAQNRIFETAQLLGVEYKEVLSTFKDFYNEMRETDIPITKVEKTTENIFKALQVGKASNEEISRTLELFDRSFKRGGMRSVGVGILSDIAPVIFDKLKIFFNKTEEGLRDMAKAGELTAEKIVAALGETDVDLDKKWEQVPQKLGKVFTRINNDLVVATAAIYKLTDASVFFGKIVWFVWTRFRDAILYVVEALGGLKSTIELLGYALAVALGPWLLSTLATAVGLTLAWAAANIRLLLSYGAMGIAIAAVAIAIQDIAAWIGGTQENWIGTHLGPFADLAENFKKLDVFSGFRLFDDAVKGNWEAFHADWKIFVGNVPAQIAVVTAAIALIGGAFILLSPIIEGVLKGIIEGLFKTKTVAVETTAAIKATETAGAAAGVGGAAAGAGGAAAKTAGTIGGLSVLGTAVLSVFIVGAAAAVGTLLANSLHQYLKDKGLVKDLDTGDERGPAATNKSGAVSIQHPWWTPDWMMKEGDERAPRPEWTKFPEYKHNEPGTGNSSIQPQINLAETIRSLGERIWYGPEAIRNESVVPSITPGAFNPNAGPRISNTEINPSLVQNNSIKVETLLDSAQIGQAIQSQMTTYGENLINGVARQLNTAGPRAEQPTQ